MNRILRIEDDERVLQILETRSLLVDPDEDYRVLEIVDDKRTLEVTLP